LVDGLTDAGILSEGPALQPKHARNLLGPRDLPAPPY